MICKLKKKTPIQCLTENKNAVHKTKKKKKRGRGEVGSSKRLD